MGKRDDALNLVDKLLSEHYSTEVREAIDILRNTIDERNMLVKVVRENFGWDNFTDTAYFKWTGPVMEMQIKEVLNAVNKRTRKSFTKKH